MSYYSSIYKFFARKEQIQVYRVLNPNNNYIGEDIEVWFGDDGGKRYSPSEFLQNALARNVDLKVHINLLEEENERLIKEAQLNAYEKKWGL